MKDFEKTVAEGITNKKKQMKSSLTWEKLQEAEGMGTSKKRSWKWYPVLISAALLALFIGIGQDVFAPKKTEAGVYPSVTGAAIVQKYVTQEAYRKSLPVIPQTDEDEEFAKDYNRLTHEFEVGNKILTKEELDFLGENIIFFEEYLAKAMPLKVLNEVDDENSSTNIIDKHGNIIDNITNIQAKAIARELPQPTAEETARYEKIQTIRHKIYTVINNEANEIVATTLPEAILLYVPKGFVADKTVISGANLAENDSYPYKIATYEKQDGTVFTFTTAEMFKDDVKDRDVRNMSLGWDPSNVKNYKKDGYKISFNDVNTIHRAMRIVIEDKQNDTSYQFIVTGESLSKEDMEKVLLSAIPK